VGYPSDLSDAEWKSIKGYVEIKKYSVSPFKYNKRAIVNATLYVIREKITWLMLPPDFPHRQTVYGHYRQWFLTGAWKKVMETLNELHSNKGESNHQAMQNEEIKLANLIKQ
jgi:transposase